MSQQSALDGAGSHHQQEVLDSKKHLAQALGVSTIVKDEVTLTKAEAELRAQALDIEDLQQFTDLYLAEGTVRLIKPTYNPIQLEQLTHTNNTLGVCIAAMETNIDGTGWELVDEDGDLEGAESLPGYEDVKALLDEPWPGMSFTTLRRKLRRDQEAVGYWALEIIRDSEGVMRFLRRAEAKLIRLVALDDPVLVEKTVRRGGADITVKVFMRERRYAMAVGKRVVYFKEYGCKRALDSRTGQWLDDEQAQLANQAGSGVVLANEMLMGGAISDTRTNYCVPRWISQIPSVLGSRKAEEYNLEFFDHGGIPPAFIFIEGGQLTGQSRGDLTDFLSGKAKFKQRAVVCELFSTSGDLNSAGHVKVNVERFGAEKQNDSMFEGYDDKCSERIRTAFRLPPLFLGKAQDFNFATAKASYMVAEAQVFKPEREEFDEIMNLTVMKELAPGVHLRSLPLGVSDIEAQLKAIEISAESATKESRIEALNEITSLNLVLEEGEDPEDAAARMVSEMMGTAPPAPDDDTINTGEGNAPVRIAATEDGRIRKMDDWVLTELADDWAGYLSGYKDFTVDQVKSMRGIMKAMTPEVRSLFSSYVGSRMVKSPMDLMGTSALLDKAGECLDHDHA